MERQTKIFLYVTGGVLLLGTISYGLYLLLKDKDTGDDTGGDDSQNSDSEATVNNYYSYGDNQQGTGTNTTGTGGATSSGNMIEPRYNGEKELSNSLSDIKGKVLYPKRTVYGGLGYSNVRSSAEVNTDRGWWDGNTNLMVTFKEGTPIGKVLEETATEFNSYGQRWFKVQLFKSYWNPLWWYYTSIGYVRADVVTFKPYEK